MDRLIAFVATLALAGASLVVGACATTADDADPTAGLRGADVSTRSTADGDTVEEYRIAGQLKMVKVTPRRGPVYYLVDSNDDGRLDSSRGEGPVAPVMYTLFKWD